MKYAYARKNIVKNFVSVLHIVRLLYFFINETIDKKFNYLIRILCRTQRYLSPVRSIIEKTGAENFTKKKIRNIFSVSLNELGTLINAYLFYGIGKLSKTLYNTLNNQCYMNKT